MKNTDKKQQAQFLYMAQGKTQKEIAETVGVSERTVYAWIHQYAWDKLRLAAFQAPATIADNLCSQLVELQNSIAAREPGNRFPTPQEAEISRKLVNSLERMKKYPGLAQNMQVLETFRNYLRAVDKDLARSLGSHIGNFLTAEGVNGYVPYQLEYGVQSVSPFAPFMQDTDEADEPAEAARHCPGNDTCVHQGQCHYPDCNSLSKKKDNTAAFHIPPIHYARQWAERAIAASAAPAITGSNPATLQLETPSVESVNPCQSVILTNQTNPEATGSNPAILQLETPSVESLNRCQSVIQTKQPAPEATGSNSAIPQPEKPSVESVDPCQSVILTNQTNPEATRSKTAIPPLANTLPDYFTRTGSDRKQTRNFNIEAALPSVTNRPVKTGKNRAA